MLKSDFIMSVFPQRTVVLSPHASEREREEIIIKNFSEATKKLSGVYGLYVADLESGYSFGIEKSTKFEAASLIKLPVMVGMFLAEEEGKLDLDSIYKLRKEDKIRG